MGLCYRLLQPAGTSVLPLNPQDPWHWRAGLCARLLLQRRRRRPDVATGRVCSTFDDAADALLVLSTQAVR